MRTHPLFLFALINDVTPKRPHNYFLSAFTCGALIIGFLLPQLFLTKFNTSATSWSVSCGKAVIALLYVFPFTDISPSCPFNIIPIVLSSKGNFINKKKIKKFKYKSFIEFSENVDDYILGNVVRLNCKNYRGGYFHFILR